VHPSAPQPEVYLAHATELFDDDGRLADERSRRQVGSLMSAFAGWVETVGPVEG